MATFTFEVRQKPTSGNPDRCFIYLRITQSREIHRIKSIEVSLKDGMLPKDVMLPSSKWVNGRFLNKEAIREAKEVKMLESILKDDMDAAKAKYHELKKKGMASSTKIRSELKSDGSSDSFCDFLDGTIKAIDEAGRYSDWKKFNGFRNKLNGFLLSKNQSDILFNELNAAFLMDFERWLHSQRNVRQPEKKLNPNFIKLQMVLFKRIINKALEKGVIKPDGNPFVAYKMPKEIKTTKDKLSSEEIRLIEDAELEEKSVIELARNTFLFSFYCAGIRFEDVALMRCANIQDGRLNYTMLKNGKIRNLKLIPEAIEIVNKYLTESSKHTDFLFPLLDNQSVYSEAITYDEIQTLSMDVKKVLYGRIGAKNALMNKELKMLAKRVGIEKNVSFHIARHSFANKAKNQGISSAKIKGLLAHSKIDTTERYMGEFATDETDAALAEIFDDGSPKAKLISMIHQMDDADVDALIQYVKNWQPSLL